MLYLLIILNEVAYQQLQNKYNSLSPNTSVHLPLSKQISTSFSRPKHISTPVFLQTKQLSFSLQNKSVHLPLSKQVSTSISPNKSSISLSLLKDISTPPSGPNTSIVHLSLAQTHQYTCSGPNTSVHLPLAQTH